MVDKLWCEVDTYYEDLYLGTDAVLAETLRTSEAEGLDAIAVSPAQGKFLGLLVQMTGAKNVLEIGALGGYSAICMARGLPEDGKLITLELSEHNAAVARRNINNAGVGEKVEVHVGPALDSLQAMVADGEAPFDFVFMDANKDGYPDYFEQTMKLVRKGAVIIADNVVREGAVIDLANQEAYVQGIRAFNERVVNEPRVSATALQTVGSKGYDGLAVLLVTAD